MFSYLGKSLNIKKFRFLSYGFRGDLHFSTFRDTCRLILDANDSTEKSQKIQELYNKVQSHQISEFVRKDDNIANWQKVEFGFPENLKFASFREISDYCHEKKIPINITILHSICHIEFNAMSMYIDTIGRFTQSSADEPEFVQDFLGIAKEESEHFQMLSSRLQEEKSYYGAIPVHNTLHENSEKTKDDLLSRIFICSLVHEARGMDSGPRLLIKLRSANDRKSLKILEKILHDEEKHVSLGIKWFKRFAEKGGQDPKEKFRQLVQDLQVRIMPPFNKEARDRANFDESWYSNL